MTTQKIYRKLRDTLMAWGVVARPQFHMRRRSTGSVRSSLQHRGTSRRFRRTSLQRLLR